MPDDHECPSNTVCPICGAPQRRSTDEIATENSRITIQQRKSEILIDLLHVQIKLAHIATVIWSQYDLGEIQAASELIGQAELRIKSAWKDLQ